jgi:acyl-CoA synthetase (AMP-forming)/AMP-acid ligase II
MAALMVGATSVPMSVFDPAATLQAIEEHGITHTGGAPTIFWAVLDHPARATTDLSSLRVAVVSAAYVPVELIHRMCDELGLDYAMTGYGLTEAHALVSLSQPGEPPDVVAEWSGRLIPGVEGKVIDDEGAEVPLGERGELLIRGFNLSDGYYRDPEATASVFQTDGWLHTGDIAYMNAEGYIKVCDRKKDMFIVGGFNVAPAEVEGMLVDWEKVAAAAVLGAPDPHYGEVGVAFVVPAAGVALTPEGVIAYARGAMANYKVPRRVEIVDALPTNATGKVLKDELRARLVP